jgi:hypothetical protein
MYEVGRNRLKNGTTGSAMAAAKGKSTELSEIFKP